MIYDDVAYQAIQTAKLAAKLGHPKPQNFPEEIWIVLREMYGKKNN